MTKIYLNFTDSTDNDAIYPPTEEPDYFTDYPDYHTEGPDYYHTDEPDYFTETVPDWSTDEPDYFTDEPDYFTGSTKRSWLLPSVFEDTGSTPAWISNQAYHKKN